MNKKKVKLELSVDLGLLEAIAKHYRFPVALFALKDVKAFKKRVYPKVSEKFFKELLHILKDTNFLTKITGKNL